jgi:hypothetical protein
MGLFPGSNPGAPITKLTLRPRAVRRPHQSATVARMGAWSQPGGGPLGWLRSRQHAAAALLFAGFVFIYLAPVLVGGKVLSPATIRYEFVPWQGRGLADRSAYYNRLLTDVAQAYYPWNVLARRFIHEGVFPPGVSTRSPARRSMPIRRPRCSRRFRSRFGSFRSITGWASLLRSSCGWLPSAPTCSSASCASASGRRSSRGLPSRCALSTSSG